MKVLITGLCLSGNLGGPAMGITLVNEMRKRNDGISFKFAIPAVNYEIEKKWAGYYGYEIVRSNNLRVHLLNKLGVLYFMYIITGGSSKIKKIIPSLNFWNVVIREHIKAYREADIIVDMSGISYVGDGFRGLFEGVISYTNFYYSQKTKRPFIRFIQSFGPFRDKKVNYFAKKEFKKTKHIFARGLDAADNCRQLVHNPDIVCDYPDIAILLPEADEAWFEAFSKCNDILKNNYILCSPSAVIYRNTKGYGCTGENYLEVFALMVKSLLLKNKKVVLLPHATSEFTQDSDKAVCYKVLDKLKTKGTDVTNVCIIDTEINPMQAKKIISKAEFCIVSRYHALVAALSSFTPVVSIGWNIKYIDILRYYESSDCSFDARVFSVPELHEKILEKINSVDRDAFIEKAKKCHKQNELKLNYAFNKLFSLIDDETRIKV